MKVQLMKYKLVLLGNPRHPNWNCTSICVFYRREKLRGYVHSLEFFRHPLNHLCPPWHLDLITSYLDLLLGSITRNKIIAKMLHLRQVQRRV